MVKSASTKVIYLGYVHAKPGVEIHIQNIKGLTGGEKVDGMSVSTTLVMTVNDIFKYERQSDYTRKDMVRRITVVPTVMERNTPEST